MAVTSAVAAGTAMVLAMVVMGTLAAAMVDVVGAHTGTAMSLVEVICTDTLHTEEEVEEEIMVMALMVHLLGATWEVLCHTLGTTTVMATEATMITGMEDVVMSPVTGIKTVREETEIGATEETEETEETEATETEEPVDVQATDQNLQVVVSPALKLHTKAPMRAAITSQQNMTEAVILALTLLVTKTDPDPQVDKRNRTIQEIQEFFSFGLI